MKGLENISRRQEQALIELLGGATYSSVAKNLKISEVTLWRWMKEPAFQARYREMRAQLVEKAFARLCNLSEKAVDCLERNLDTGNRSAEVRTALGILAKNLEAESHYNHDTRIAALEDNQGKK